jgi:hypothetical protein
MGAKPVTIPSKPRELMQAIALVDVQYIRRRGREQQVLDTIERVRNHWWRTGYDCEHLPHLMRLKLNDLSEVATTCVCYSRIYEKAN